MDDIKIIIWVVFLIIFIIRKVMGAKKKREENTFEQDTATTPSPEKKGRSFEELLQEFTANAAPQASKPVEKQYASAPKTIQEFKDRKEEKAAYDKAVALYDEVKHNYDYDPPLETTDPKVHSVYKGDYQRFEEFEEEESHEVGAEIKEMLQDSDSARKAIILQEVLGRKYE